MKSRTAIAFFGLFILGVGAGILGTLSFSEAPSPRPAETNEALSMTEYKLLEDKLERTEATVATQKGLLEANGDFLDALYEFELSLSIENGPTQKQLDGRVRVQELRVLVGAERTDPEVIVKATEEVEAISKNLRTQ